jgi:hypothetical protein
MAQSNIAVPGPVPAGSAVLITLVPMNEDGAPTALDGALNAVNDQAQAPTNAAGGAIGDQPDPLSLQCLVQPPSDLTLDSTITGGDTDGDPSFIVVIDWNGPVVIKSANQFGLTATFVPATV